MQNNKNWLLVFYALSMLQGSFIFAAATITVAEEITVAKEIKTVEAILRTVCCTRDDKGAAAKDVVAMTVCCTRGDGPAIERQSALMAFNPDVLTLPERITTIKDVDPFDDCRVAALKGKRRSISVPYRVEAGKRVKVVRHFSKECVREVSSVMHYGDGSREFEIKHGDQIIDETTGQSLIARVNSAGELEWNNLKAVVVQNYLYGEPPVSLGLLPQAALEILRKAAHSK